MCNAEPVTLLIDMKKYRLRIHKSTLHKLDDPEFIQLLINPRDMVMALHPLKADISGDQSHKVTITSDNSVEIYSRSFVEKLNEVSPKLHGGNSYRLTGSMLPEHRMAVFSFATAKNIDLEGSSHASVKNASKIKH